MILRTSLLSITLSFAIGCATHAEPSKESENSLAKEASGHKMVDAKTDAVKGASPKKEISSKKTKVKTVGKSKTVSKALQRIHFNELQKFVRKFRDSKSSTFNLVKEEHQALLGEDFKLSGKLYIKKGKMKMEITEPADKKSLLVSDRKKVVVVNFLSKKLGGKPQVTVIRTGGQIENQGLFGLLMGSDSVWNELEVENRRVAHNYTYTLRPKKKSKLKDVKKIVIKIENKEVSELSYWDDVENHVVHKLSKVASDKILPDHFFQYKIPKDAEVTRY